MPEPDKKLLFLHIGDYHASNQPMVLTTLLGSCVSTCLFDPIAKVGGMNHILLPGNGDMKHFNASARYGINAMELLINRIMVLGGRRQRLIAKLFGGAHLLPEISKANGTGQKNIAFAETFLKNENIPIRAANVGGVQSRRIFFHTDTGDVFLKRASIRRAEQIDAQEQQRLDQIRVKSQRPATIEWFND